MGVSQLGYLGFGVSDVEGWTAYATEVLGMEVSGRAADGTVYLRLDEHHHRIALHADGRDDLAYAGFQTASREAFEETKRRLFDGGVEYVQGSDAEIANRMVRDLVKFEVGTIPLEVYYGPKVLFEQPFRPSARITGFRTGPLGMGHVGLNPDDGEELARVLVDCLGFRVSDALGGGERFFHCNGREHTVVIGRPGLGGDKKIGHFMLELNSLDDVGSCLDRCEDRGIEITSRLGKHTNDHMISFYMRTPSGFRMEYGWNGRLIDEETWQVQIYDKASVWGHRPPAQPAAR